MSKPPILLNPENKAIHEAIGRAVDANAHLEGSQAMLLEQILGVPPHAAWIIFFSAQNTRARYEMLQALLSLKHGDKYTRFWKACGTFLQRLSKFRNALVHWQPAVSLYQNEKGLSHHAHELMHPTKMEFRTLKTEDVPNFVKDCRYIEQEIHALSRELKSPSGTPPDKFSKPNLRQNLAVLERRTSKARQSQKPQSKPMSLGKAKKLSARQRRERALRGSKQQ